MRERAPCQCGHIYRDHVGDPTDPGYLLCKMENCDCIGFEWDGKADTEDEP